MIGQFSVSNFKSIRNKMILSFVPNGKVKNEHDNHLKITVNEKTQLLKLGLLYGYNASGKSNIIEAVQTLRNIVTHGSRVKEGIPYYHPFEFDDDSRNNPTEFSLDFFVDGIRFLYTISYNSNTIVEESLFYWPETSRRKIFERHYNNALDTSDISFGTDCDLTNADKLMLKANTINNNSLMFAYQMTNISSKILDCVSTFFRENFINTVTPQKDLSLYGVNNLYENIKEGAFYSKLMEKADFQITNLEIVDTDTSGKGIFVDKSVQPAKSCRYGV
ncbi:MAG TPA: ATP-binding protein [Candidatus Ornithospirochaeta stercorigallinarum]|nr:ATP-binding protein [Candidatus Ornithospirochaeta stercorigallinarum]